MDALELLSRQHTEVDDLLRRLALASEPPDRERLRDEVVRMLAAHMAVEEELLYPRLEPHEDVASLVDVAFRDHDEIREILGELVQCDVATRDFPSTAAELAEVTRAHVTAEEAGIFQGARPLLGEELDEMAIRIARRHREVLAGPPKLDELVEA